MFRKSTMVFIILVSLGLALGCGLMDHETESLTHLLTAELGNVVALFLYTALFFGIGMLFAITIKTAVAGLPGR